MDDYAELLHQLRNRYYAEPAIAQKAADAITALLAERDAARAENERLAKDAARYRWIAKNAMSCGHGGIPFAPDSVDCWEFHTPDHYDIGRGIDAAIDAAIRPKPHSVETD